MFKLYCCGEGGGNIFWGEVTKNVRGGVGKKFEGKVAKVFFGVVWQKILGVW